MASEVSARLALRSADAGVSLTTDLSEKLVAYYELLERWNRKINLTSFTNPDEAFDRLLLEPIAAASALPSSPHLIDLGSGGGSPAIPLALALQSRFLVMVESRSRKAAFLREAARQLGLIATVENARFEEVMQSPGYASAFDLVTIRAVKIDDAALAAAARFAKSGGSVALFQASRAPALALPATLESGNSTLLFNGARLALLIRR